MITKHQVVPEKLGVGVRDGIRSQLLDEAMLHYLEGHSAINWQTTVVWQARPLPQAAATLGARGAAAVPQHQGREGEGEWVNLDHLAPQLEQGYHSGSSQAAFRSGFNTFQVDYAHKQLVNQHTGGLFEMRRLAFAPLMPLKVQMFSNLICFLAYFRLKMITALSTMLPLLASGVFTIVPPSSARQLTSR